MELCNNFFGIAAYLHLNHFKTKNKIMKSKFLFSLVLVAGLILANFSSYQVYGQTPQDKPVKQQLIKYTCPVHPEIVQDMPGKCPKCGMKLIEQKDMSKGEMHMVKDSTMMNHDNMEMMHDSTMMKKSHMMHDSTMMKESPMMHDSTMRKKSPMMQDLTTMRHDRVSM
jgi:hypothetical protein